MDLPFVLDIIEDALLVLLDCDFEASIDQPLGGGGGERGATLELLGLAAQPKAWCRHVLCVEGRKGEDRGCVTSQGLWLSKLYAPALTRSSRSCR